jgi:hypothetical protein
VKVQNSSGVDIVFNLLLSIHKAGRLHYHPSSHHHAAENQKDLGAYTQAEKEKKTSIVP